MDNIYKNGVADARSQAKALREYLEKEFGVTPDTLDKELEKLEAHWNSRIEGKQPYEHVI